MNFYIHLICKYIRTKDDSRKKQLDDYLNLLFNKLNSKYRSKKFKQRIKRKKSKYKKHSTLRMYIHLIEELNEYDECKCWQEAADICTLLNLLKKEKR